MDLEYLEGFAKRMQFVAVVASIVDRKNTNTEIEGWFEQDELDNLFFTLLVYIMEQTLNENDECTMDNIARFLDGILKEYHKSLDFSQITRLAEYMIKDILQNKGTVKSYGTMDYEAGWHRLNIRLISDKITEGDRIIYQLTDQGYDFLFRTKEVDKELDFKLERMKLKELLRRKNYRHALRQSRDLIAMLRQKKRELEEFVYRTWQNIHAINRGEHEKLLNETYSLIDEEYEEMMTLKAEINRDEERIARELEEGIILEEPLIAARENLTAIKRNLQIVINEQRNLIAGRFHMNEIYEETIRNSFYSSIVKRYDFDKEILQPLEQADDRNFQNLWKLMTPLMYPAIQKKLNLSLIYQSQGKIRDTEEEEGVLDEGLLEEDTILRINHQNNAIHLSATKKLLQYAGLVDKPFRFSEFYQDLAEHTHHLHQYTDNKRIFLILLKLYEQGVIDFGQWKKRAFDEVVTEANGEFDLAWTLVQIEQENPNFYDLEKLFIENSTEDFRVTLKPEDEPEGLTTTIEMNDLILTPIRKAAESNGY